MYMHIITKPGNLCIIFSTPRRVIKIKTRYKYLPFKAARQYVNVANSVDPNETA